MMKNALALLLACILAVSSATVAVAAEASRPPAVISDAYVVMNADTGQILIEKNMDKREYPASITKVLTVALGLENAAMEDQVTASRVAVTSIEPNSSHIALQPDEVVSMKDLVYAAMLPSANDAANVIGEHVGGSLQGFADMMTKKAAELGCKDSLFANPSGLPDPNHYTTAHDMALITKYALGVPGFTEVFGGEEYTIQPTNKQPSARLLGTDHMMLVTSKYYYEGTRGGKLGWTQEAQHTAVTLAEKNGMRLICVVLKSANKFDKYKDSTALFNYCFDNFSPVSIPKSQVKAKSVPRYLAGGAVDNISVFGKESYTLLLHNSLTKNDVSIDYNIPDYYSDDVINPQVVFSVNSAAMYGDAGSYPLDFMLPPVSPVTLPSDDVPQVAELTPLQSALRVTGIVLLWVLGVCSVLFFIMLIIRYINKYRKNKRRMQRIRHLRRYEAENLVHPPATRTQRQVRRTGNIRL